MKTLLFSIFCTFFSTTVLAESEKNLSIGLGTYSLSIIYNDAFAIDDEFSGTAISALYATSNRVAFRGTYYSLDHDDLSLLENTGFDLLAYYGKGFTKPGLKAFFGGGIYNENWKLSSFNSNFNGLQFSGGIGYNWDAVSLDLMVALREPGDYDKLIQNTPGLILDPIVLSISLILSARF